MAHTFHRYRVGDEPVSGYRLESHLGAGGFGEVWKATAPGGTEVALKIIDLTGQQGLQEFTSLRVVKKVRHPNLISLQAFWMKDEDGQIVDEAGEPTQGAASATAFMPDAKRQTQSSAIAMTAKFARPVELIIAMQLGAMSLHKRLEDCREQGHPGVPVAELLEYLEQAARGIDFLNKPIHDLGKGPMPIVHGDVKPHNILVVGDAAVVCDFGLARAVETLRKTSMAPVTVAYAAPESFKGKVTPTSDQYSLAITYVELRTGRLPFDETMTPYQVMEAHVLRKLDFSRLPEPERLVVLRSTDVDPDARFSSSRDMVLALRRAVAETGELPLRPGEVAYTGGPTPSHSLTARPKPHDTDLPTRVPVDPHKDTMHPGGHTPSELFTQHTTPAPVTGQRGSDALAETAMHAPTAATTLPAPRKSKGLLIGGAVVAAAIVLGVVFVPKLLDRSQGNAGTGGVEVEGDPADPIARYVRDVQTKINSGDFNAAIQLLAIAPSKLPPYQKESLEKRLKDGFIANLAADVQNRDYPRAVFNLDNARSGIGLSAEEKQRERQKIRDAWLGQAQDELQNDDAAGALETATTLLRSFDGDRGGQVVAARAKLRSGDNAGAATDLNKIGATATLPAESQPLHAGVLLLATGLDSAAPVDWKKLLDGFVAYAALDQSAVPPDLALTAWERGRLEGLRGDTVRNVERLLATLPPDQAAALLGKLEQLGTTSELQLFKVKSLLDGKQYADARKLLAEVTAKIPSGAESLKAEAAAAGLLIDLRDPNSPAAETAKALATATQTLGKLSPGSRSELSAAAEEFAVSHSSDWSALTDALSLVGQAWDLDPQDKQLATRVARLNAARLILVPAMPELKKDLLPEIVEACQQVEAAGLNNATIDALHAECLLAQSSRDRQLMLTLVDRAAPADGYTQFVQASVLRTLPQPEWPKIAGLLATAFGDSAKPPPALSAPFRQSAAAKMLIESAAKKRAAAPSTAAAVLTNPFNDPAAADEAYRWLSLARDLTGKLESQELKLTPPQQRELATNLALAAAWKTKPDNGVAREFSTPLTKLSDAELSASALPMLRVAFRVQGDQPADQSQAIQAAQRFVELFQKQYAIADPQAVTVYDEVLKPALALADRLATSKTPPPDLDKFYAAAADFIGHYQRAAWPFPDKQKEIEKLLSAAIKLNPKAAKYFTTRGAARISQTPPNVEGALADAAEAGKLDANLPAAYALQGHALIYRSRRQPTRDSRLADLQQALVNCRAAIEKSKPDDEKRAMHLLYLSMALLEKSNLDNDTKVKKEMLTEAVAKARQAVELEKAYPDYALVALGNALEDVAWLVGDEPEQNYLAAIDAFSQAINSSFAAPDPWIGRARCFYKAIVDSKLDPKFLGRTKAEALQAAISDLEQARQLKADLTEPNLWLAKANQQLAKFTEADAALAEAVRLAEEQKLPERALYLVEWTRNAALNSNLTAADRSKLVRERAELLKAAPSLGGASTAKQAALLIGESLLADKKLPEALKEYDAALSDYDKADPAKPLDPNKADGSDVSLLLARAYCRLSPTSEWNLTAAESVLKDVERIVQLKPGPRLEALASWYSANAQSRSVLSTSPTFTAEKKREFSDGAIAATRKAIELAPTDPASWEWRSFGARLLGAKVSPAGTPPDTIKKLGTQARQWIDEAIAMVAKRPDLSSQLPRLQSVQQQLDAALAAKGLPRT